MASKKPTPKSQKAEPSVEQISEEIDSELAGIIDPPNANRNGFMLAETKNEQSKALQRKEINLPDEIDTTKDFEYVRENLRSLSENGFEALRDLMVLAKGSDSARAFEAISALVKTISDVNKDMMDLHVKKTEIDKKSDKATTQNNTQNNNYIFTGTTEEMAEMMAKLQQK